jgi:hypothetical protein
MACPECGCKVTYQYDDGWDGMNSSEELERCSACGHIFDIEDSEPEDEDPYIPEPESFMINGGKG